VVKNETAEFELKALMRYKSLVSVSRFDPHSLVEMQLCMRKDPTLRNPEEGALTVVWITESYRTV